MTDEPRRKPARRKLAQKLALAILLVPITFLVLELGLRAWLALRGSSYSAARTMESLAGFTTDITLPGRGAEPIALEPSDPSHGTMLHPYIGFGDGEFFDRVTKLAEYYRTPEARETYDIVILGGSVAYEYGFEARARLAPQLATSPELRGRSVEIRGFAYPGFKQPQQVALLTYLLAAGHEPDAVIALDGFNELAVASENARRGANPLFPSYFEIGSLLRDRASDPAAMRAAIVVTDRRDRIASLVASVRPRLTARSAIVGTWLVRRVQRLHAEALQALAAYRDVLASKDFPLNIRGPRYDHDPDAVQAMCIRAWQESARTLQAICRARGIHYLHVLQPALHDIGSKPMTENEKNATWPAEWIDDVRRGYPKLRAAGEELAREGVNLLDASRVFESTTQEIYRDGCHFGIEGCTVLTRFLAPVFLRTISSEPR